MIISLLVILSISGIYCPLTLNGPSKRLNMLFNETKSKFILAHELTKEKLQNNESLISIDRCELFVNSDKNIYRNSSVTLNNHLYAIFTSSSTSTPKYVRISIKHLCLFSIFLKILFQTLVSHRNFISCIQALFFSL